MVDRKLKQSANSPCLSAIEPETDTAVYEDSPADNAEKVMRRYFRLYPKLSRLGSNVEQAVRQFLEKEHIGYVSVTHRVKQLNRFLEKIERKRYNQPFIQVNDLVGLRIVCFFQSDVTRIAELIAQEFEVVRDRDKNDSLPPTQFGYRSHHLVVSINKDWIHSPNYRGLENLRIEIQVRTVLMHAWAEIEHRLAYKRREHIPSQFRRKFSMLSAKLEEADEQFEELAEAIRNLKSEIHEQTAKVSEFDRNLNLNLDTLQAFLDFQHPGDQRSMRQTRVLLDDLFLRNMTVADLVDGYASDSSANKSRGDDKGKNAEKAGQVESARRILKLNGRKKPLGKRPISNRNRSNTKKH